MLTNKVAVITGSNRGIGKSILIKFAENGATVFAHARRYSVEHEQHCEALILRYGVKITPIYFDVCCLDEMKEGIKTIRSLTDKIDILVNNIGCVNSAKLFQMTSINEIRNEFEVNFFSSIQLTQYLSRFMIKAKSGSIINITACAAMDGYSGMLPYVSSKSAIIGATKRLAIELGEFGVRVNAIAPGLTDTDMSQKMSRELTDKTLEHVIMKRKAKPEEIANVVIFLASSLASYITGQIIRVDGGMLL